jgi:hypothetical protein
LYRATSLKSLAVIRLRLLWGRNDFLFVVVGVLASVEVFEAGWISDSETEVLNRSSKIGVWTTGVDERRLAASDEAAMCFVN